MLFTVISPTCPWAITQCQQRLWRSRQHRPTEEEVPCFSVVIHPPSTKSLQRNLMQSSSTGKMGCIYFVFLACCPAPFSWPSVLPWSQTACGDATGAPHLVWRAGNPVSGFPRAAQTPYTPAGWHSAGQTTAHPICCLPRHTHHVSSEVAHHPVHQCRGTTARSGTRGKFHLLLTMPPGPRASPTHAEPGQHQSAQQASPGTAVRAWAWHRFATCEVIAPHPPCLSQVLSIHPRT